MKALLAKLLGMFRQPEPTKPVDPRPFPKVTEDFAPRKEAAKATPKKRVSAKPKKVAAKGVVAAAKKTAAKKKAK